MTRLHHKQAAFFSSLTLGSMAVASCMALTGCDAPIEATEAEAFDTDLMSESSGDFEEDGSSGEDLDPYTGVDEFADPLDDDVQPIVTGPNTTTDTDTNPRWPEAVRLCGGGGCCSGTLISPTHVLTAGHCGFGSNGTVFLSATSATTDPDATRQFVRTQTLSPQVASGRDLAVVLIDEAVPTFGQAGAPDFSVDPAPSVLSAVSNSFTTYTVGFGPSNDCTGAGGGTRRGLRYNGGFRTYSSQPGVVTRQNLPCSDVNKGPSPGDSGGPLLDVFGRVVGVFSGWSCRNTTGARIGGAQCNSALSNSSGTIEWTGVSGPNATWLSGALSGDFDGDGIDDVDDPLPSINCNGSSPPSACDDIKPEFEIVSIASSGCTGTGGDPTVAVTVRNDGPQRQWMWVDLWVGRSSAPSVGDYSSNYQRSRTLEHRETQTLTFTVNPTATTAWVDVVVDTTQSHDELNESNNVSWRRITFPDCSFG